jgi:nitrogen regulatory protein P-II 1
MSVTNSLGCGAQMGYEESYRGIKFEVNLMKKIRLEIAVSNSFLKSTVETIIQSARTGEIGDGKIFVLELSDCIRIRTGEHGKEAIG